VHHARNPSLIQFGASSCRGAKTVRLRASCPSRSLYVHRPAHHNRLGIFFFSEMRRKERSVFFSYGPYFRRPPNQTRERTVAPLNTHPLAPTTGDLTADPLFSRSMAVSSSRCRLWLEAICVCAGRKRLGRKLHVHGAGEDAGVRWRWQGRGALDGPHEGELPAGIPGTLFEFDLPYCSIFVLDDSCAAFESIGQGATRPLPCAVDTRADLADVAAEEERPIRIDGTADLNLGEILLLVRLAFRKRNERGRRDVGRSNGCQEGTGGRQQIRGRGCRGNCFHCGFRVVEEEDDEGAVVSCCTCVRVVPFSLTLPMMSCTP
jgi:hypothetical protein